MATAIEEKYKSIQTVNYGQRSNYQRCVKNFHIRTMHLGIIKLLFIHQLMH